MARRLAIVVAALISVAGPMSASSAPIPSPLQGVRTSARAVRESATGIFRYEYRIVNPAINDGEIVALRIELTRSPNDVELPQQGLANGPRYSPHGSEAAQEEVPMVPVGISGPEGWLYGLGVGWGLGGYASWGSSDDPFTIRPGTVAEGFTLTSYGLPGLRRGDVVPDINTDLLPEEFSDPEKVRALKDQLTLRLTTVGPKAPPKDFVPTEFLNYLISILHQSRQLGWIRVEGVQRSLLAKLISAKRKLEVGDAATAKNILTAFLNEVSATSCAEFACAGNKPLTSEAHALLFFNGEFLVSRIP